jgi:hypothetical protein
VLVAVILADAAAVRGAVKKSKSSSREPKNVAAMMAVEAADVRKGVPRAVSRQLSICMGSVTGNALIVYESRTVVSGIFAAIGVKIRWVDPVRCDAGTILVSFSSDTSARINPSALAYAMPYEGTHVVVFLERVKEKAPSFGERLLGYTLAHEVSHIVEGVALHSESGIMKAHWGIDELCQIRTGRFGFATNDISLIYRGLYQRKSRLGASTSATPNRHR